MPRSRKTEPRIWEQTFLLNHFILKAINEQIEKRYPVGWSGRIIDVGCGSLPYRKLSQDDTASMSVVISFLLTVQLSSVLLTICPSLITSLIVSFVFRFWSMFQGHGL